MYQTFETVLDPIHSSFAENTQLYDLFLMTWNVIKYVLSSFVHYLQQF